MLVELIEKMSKLEIFITSGGSVAIISHLLYKFKLRSEQRVRFENIIGDEIVKSLIEIRELIEEASVIERYDIIKYDTNDGLINAFEGTIYPSIMNDVETLDDYSQKIDDMWKKHGKNLDCETALYLWYGSRYFSQLLFYVVEEGYQNQLPELGTFFIFDIQQWHLSFDKNLVKRINRPLNKIEHHQGKKWARKRKGFIKKWEETFLYKTIYDFHDNIPEINDFFEYLEELKNQNT